jgi:hypothetical protein
LSFVQSLVMRQGVVHTELRTSAWHSRVLQLSGLEHCSATGRSRLAGERQAAVVTLLPPGIWVASAAAQT